MAPDSGAGGIAGSSDVPPPTEPGTPDDQPPQGFDNGAGPQTGPVTPPRNEGAGEQALQKGDPGRGMQANPDPNTQLAEEGPQQGLLIGGVVVFVIMILGCVGGIVVAFLLPVL